MAMGDLNTSPTFVAMTMKLQIEWYTLDKECVEKNVASKIIVDDVLLYGRTVDQILAYFRKVLYLLKHHRATLKPKNHKWFQDMCKFVDMDVVSVVKQSEQSKNEAFAKMDQPNKCGGLRMLIGIFGFQIQFLPLYDLYI